MMADSCAETSLTMAVTKRAISQVHWGTCAIHALEIPSNTAKQYQARVLMKRVPHPTGLHDRFTNMIDDYAPVAPCHTP